MIKGVLRQTLILVMAAVMVFCGTAEGFGADGSSSGKDEITITLTGDLMCDTKFQRFLYDEEAKTFEFDPTFKYVKKIFNDSDFTVGNLETCVSSSHKISRDLHFKNNEPYMNAPKKFLRALKRAGYDGLILANNHTLDTGLSGLRNTIDAIDELGLKHTGLYKSSGNKHYFTFKKNGIKVAFLAYATYYNYYDYTLTYAQRQVYLSQFSEAKVKADVKAAKDAGADYIIAYMHAGDENTYKISQQQKTICNALTKYGVDYIVGSHPHYLQRKGAYYKGSKKVPVIYSLGNFTGKLRRKKTRETAILKITLKKDDKGKVSLKKKEFIPVFMVTKWAGKKMVLLPEGTKAGKKSREMLEKHFKHIRKIINNQ
ncbi:MAG: CapA family protein [Firmicutes bacterium]|nr:CapA family protein [Bacillota bacterium]